MAINMSKKFQLIFSSIMVLSCICVLIYCVNFIRRPNVNTSSKDVFKVVRENKHIENTDVYDKFLNNFNCQEEKILLLIYRITRI